ncbi:MAG: HepT-like ribonuclease domain-containing protein [Candidatus Anstonellales archaeon]
MRAEILERKIAEHLKKVEKYKEMYEKEKREETFDALAMNCFQAINYFLDISELAAKKSDENAYFSTYIDIFELLKRKNIINEDEFRLVSSLISYRNKIAHQYHIINERELMLTVFYLSQLHEIVKKIASSIRK